MTYRSTDRQVDGRLTHRWVKLVDEQIGFQIDRQEDSRQIVVQISGWTD